MTPREHYVDLVTHRFRQVIPGAPWELLDPRSDEQLHSELSEVVELSSCFDLDSNERAKLDMIRSWIAQALMIRSWRGQPVLSA
jgi:hypothetical protein